MDHCVKYTTINNVSQHLILYSLGYNKITKKYKQKEKLQVIKHSASDSLPINLHFVTVTHQGVVHLFYFGI